MQKGNNIISHLFSNRAASTTVSLRASSPFGLIMAVTEMFRQSSDNASAHLTLCQTSAEIVTECRGAVHIKVQQFSDPTWAESAAFRGGKK